MIDKSASLLIGVIFVAFLFPLNVLAQSEEQIVEEIVVVGELIGELGLSQPSSAGSRLGLTLLETPATVETISSSIIRARGYQQISDAVASLPGVVSGESPAAPSTFSMRGFTRSQITVLRDGLWVGPANMVMRPQNTFNLDRIEVLRGPSSVLNGQGAVAGTINAISRSAEAEQSQSVDVLASYGRYDSYQLGVGAGGALSDSTWYRVDVSQRESSGYVDRMDPESFNATASVLFQPSEQFSIKLSADYLDDDLADYWGTPLVPTSAARRPMNDVISTRTGETIDARSRFRNYNVADSRAESDQLFLRADLTWMPNERFTLKNTTYKFDADREWLNAEGYVYCNAVVDVCTQTGVIQRYYGYFFVFHDQDLIGNRLTGQYDFDVSGMDNRLLIGTEITDLDFERARGFRRSAPLAPGDAVDLFSPVPGRYGPEELRGVSPTDIQTFAVFAEDALQINDRLSVITAVRYEELELDRKNFDAAGVQEASGFERDFNWISWRLGSVFKLTDNVVLYAQYSDAKDPVNANIFLVNAGEDFDLTDAEQWEIGLKAVFSEGKAEATLAYYDIERDDVLERIGLDSAGSVGGRESRGIEISATIAANDYWRIGANAAYTDAEFKRSANFVNFAGNTPPNVPELTGNLWSSLRLTGVPIELGAALRFVDDRYGDSANNITLKSYLLLDAYASWTHKNLRVSARISNVTDEDYASWADVFYLQQNDPGFLYANQLLLGSPRTYELSFEASFQVGARVTRLLVFVHRWIGICLGLLFAMWFATGMVMMYVPYPSLSDSDRLAMMETIDYTKLNVAPAAALSKCPPMLTGFRAITLTNRPAYVCHTSDNATHVVYGDNGQLAPHLTASVVERRVHEVFSKPLKSIEGPMDYDQWIVANKFDPYRPFLQVAMADDAGTHYYVSTITGEFLQRTTRHERVWNYLGAVLHWIYPTVLRKDHALWDKTVWWLSLVALVGTASGVYLGLYRTLKVRASGRRTLSSFKENWMRWHHILGLFTGILVLSWIFSGWLSMDHGRLFSTPSATLTQQNLLRGSSLSEIVSRVDLGSLTSLHPASEVTIHALDGEYVILAQDHNGLINSETLGFAQIRRAIIAAWPEQKVVSLKVVPDDDAYTNLREGQLPAGTIRAVLDDSNSTWIHLDAFSGEVLSVMDRGRRVYRWLFNGLHSLDFPWLAKHRPVWDIVMFIGLFAGFSVSVTGTVIGLRRLLRSGQFMIPSDTISTFLASFTLIGLAEVGDKSQIVCMALASRHRHGPVLLGAATAFLLLNTLAVIFGAGIAAWLPEQATATIVALLFAAFGLHALFTQRDDESEEISELAGYSVFLTTLSLIFLAEFGDKTQIAVAGLASNMALLPVWAGATTALILVSALGVWVGRALLQNLQTIWLHRVGGAIFLVFAAIAGWRALS